MSEAPVSEAPVSVASGRPRRAVLGLFAASAAVPLLAGCGGHSKHAAKEAAKDGATGSAPAVAPVASAVSSAGSGPGGPDVIMIIRHAEKPTGSGAPYGITADGKRDSESLTVQGWTRAGALVGLFAPRDGAGAPAPVRTGLVRPTGVHAADPSTGGSQRPEETATPTAAALGVQLDLRFAKGQEAALAAALLASAGPRLVAWEHESIAAIIDHLGPVSPTPPSAWPDDRFDLVWVLTARSGGGWDFTQVPQMLLAGDSTEPIG